MVGPYTFDRFGIRYMKILHVAETARGGVGTYLSEVLPYQVKQSGKHSVRALLPDTHATQVTGVDRRVVRTWRRRARSLRSSLHFALAIRREVRRFKPDLVHAHSSLAGLFVRLMYGWRYRRPSIIYCPHGWAFDRESLLVKTRMLMLIERVLAPLCDRIIAVSSHERQQALRIGIPHCRVALVLNGIADRAPSRPSDWHDQRVKCLFVGRLDRQKGLDTLLDAIEPLQNQLCLRVIGNAVASPKSDGRSARNVEYLGWRSAGEIDAEIASADLVVVPSRWEAFGLVALEAMRGSRAVVASSTGGLPEIIRDGETGRLVPPDSPGALMEVLSSGTRSSWQAMGRAGRTRFVEQFTSDRMNAELLVAYASILHRLPNLGENPLVANA